MTKSHQACPPVQVIDNVKVEQSAKKQKPAQKAPTPVAAPAPACISQPVTSGSHRRTSPRQKSAKKAGQQQIQEIAAAANNGRPGSELVGKRVRIFWAADDAWFPGSLSEFSKSSGEHLCEYDDGDREWLKLSSEKYELGEQSGGMSNSPYGLAVYALPIPTRSDVCMASRLPHAQNKGVNQLHGCNEEQKDWKSSIAWGFAGPPPRRLSFGGRRRAANKKQLVLDDSDEEDADMADAASEEVSGSEFEAADASSSSEDEDESTAVEASDEVSCCGHGKPRLYSACAVAQLSVQCSEYSWHGKAQVQTSPALTPALVSLWVALHEFAGACRGFWRNAAAGIQENCTLGWHTVTLLPVRRTTQSKHQDLLRKAGKGVGPGSRALSCYRDLYRGHIHSI